MPHDRRARGPNAVCSAPSGPDPAQVPDLPLNLAAAAYARALRRRGLDVLLPEANPDDRRRQLGERLRRAANRLAPDPLADRVHPEDALAELLEPSPGVAPILECLDMLQVAALAEAVA
ncbi:MAG: hypothetical protein AAF907_03020 [Planctomycetota bacterium]